MTKKHVCKLKLTKVVGIQLQKIAHSENLFQMSCVNYDGMDLKLEPKLLSCESRRNLAKPKRIVSCTHLRS